ncbi:MAG: M14 family zinc carboxypeptidase [Stenotrophobium sp.]
MPQIHIKPFNTGDFPELDALGTLMQRAGGLLRSEVVHEVQTGKETLPVHCLELGSTSALVPAVGFFGGIHGIERIGAQVIITFLHALVERLQWDDSLAQMLEQVRLVFMPLVNPGGMRNRTRCNPAGVDLMRNAPVDADGRVPFLLGGQRFSHHRRGTEGVRVQRCSPKRRPYAV